MSDDKSSWLKDALGFVVDKVEDAAGVASTIGQAESDTLAAGVDAATGVAKQVSDLASSALKTVEDEGSKLYQGAKSAVGGAAQVVEDEADDLKKKAGQAWDDATQKVAGAAEDEKNAITGAVAQRLQSIGLTVQNIGTCAHDYLTLADAVGRCVEALGDTPDKLVPQITSAARAHNLATIPAILLSSEGIQTLAGVSTAISPLVDCLSRSNAQANKGEIATLSKLKHDIDAVIKFLQSASGAQPATAGAPGSAGEVAAAGAGSLGPMGRDCKIVRGKVPGPRNHVLCGTHHHILDEAARMIIANDLDDYKRRYAKHGAAGAAAYSSAGQAASTQPASRPLSSGPPSQGQERMTAACKPVHGKVPGPRNHVLCGTHQHILDTDAGLVIAKDLDEYKRRYTGGAKPAAAPPSRPGADMPLNMTRPREPMQTDCVAVHGKVPGPAHHLLCKTHGHVLDIKAKTIIAENLDDYKQQFK
jgi:hypothetical protein